MAEQLRQRPILAAGEKLADAARVAKIAASTPFYTFLYRMPLDIGRHTLNGINTLLNTANFAADRNSPDPYKTFTREQVDEQFSAGQKVSTTAAGVFGEVFALAVTTEVTADLTQYPDKIFSLNLQNGLETSLAGLGIAGVLAYNIDSFTRLAKKEFSPENRANINAVRRQRRLVQSA